MNANSSKRRLARAALLTMVVHIVAGVLLLIVRPGLPTNDALVERMSFVDDRRGLWRLAWLTWHAAAFSFLWFVICAAAAWAPGERRGRFAIVLATCGVGLDLSGQALAMGVLPELGSYLVARDYEQWERASELLMGYAGNGLYTLATALLVWIGARRLPAWATWAGVVAVIGGCGLSFTVLRDALGPSLAGLWSLGLLCAGFGPWLGGAWLDALAPPAQPRGDE